MPAMLPYALYECFVVVVEMFIASLFLGSFFSPSDAGRRRAAGYCAFCAAMMCLSAAQASPAVLLAATAVGVFLLARFFYEGGIASKLMASGLFCVLVVAADIACVWVCAAVWHIESAGVGAYGPERVLFAAVAKLAQILLVKLAGLAAHGRRRAPVAARIREAAPLLACQLLSVALACHIYASELGRGAAGMYFVLAAMAGIMYANAAMYWCFDYVLAAHDLERQKDAAGRLLGQQLAYYRALEEQQAKTGMLWHDIKKHAGAVRQLAAGGHAAEAGEYMAALEDRIAALQPGVRTAHPLVNAVLGDWLGQAKSRGIELGLDVRLCGELRVPPMDLCALIGNAMDNAIAACGALPAEPPPGRRIDVYICQKPGGFMMEVKNTHGPAQRGAGSRRRKGMGLMIIEGIAAENGGHCDISDDGGLFCVSVVLPAPSARSPAGGAG